MKKTLLFTLFLVLSNASNAESKKRYDDDESFGGPAETGAQLEADDKDKKPIFRFPAVDTKMQSWADWKHQVYQDTGLQFGFDYTAIHHKLSDTLSPELDDTGSSGIARFYGKWELTGKNTKNKGALVFKIDNRHKFGDTPVNAIGGNAGYLSQTAYIFNDMGTLLVDLNWQQTFNDGNTGLVIGRFDPNDYFDVLGYAIPWTSFSNLDSSISMSTALADVSFGVGIGHWFNESIYMQAAANDANGTLDSHKFFFEEGFDELYKTVEFGWSPSKADRYFKNFHVTLWQMDDHTAYGENDISRDGSKGISFGANWTWDNEWMVFTKFGFSDVDSASDAQLYEQDIKLGFMKYFDDRSDLLGMSIAYGKIPDEFGTPNDSQTTFEAFYRFQLAQRLAITPNIQYLIDPALNTEDDVTVIGMRLRLTL